MSVLGDQYVSILITRCDTGDHEHWLATGLNELKSAFAEARFDMAALKVLGVECRVYVVCQFPGKRWTYITRSWQFTRDQLCRHYPALLVA